MMYLKSITEPTKHNWCTATKEKTIIRKNQYAVAKSYFDNTSKHPEYYKTKWHFLLALRQHYATYRLNPKTCTITYIVVFSHLNVIFPSVCCSQKHVLLTWIPAPTFCIIVVDTTYLKFCESVCNLLSTAVFIWSIHCCPCRASYAVSVCRTPNTESCRQEVAWSLSCANATFSTPISRKKFYECRRSKTWTCTL